MKFSLRIGYNNLYVTQEIEFLNNISETVFLFLYLKFKQKSNWKRTQMLRYILKGKGDFVPVGVDAKFHMYIIWFARNAVIHV